MKNIITKYIYIYIYFGPKGGLGPLEPPPGSVPLYATMLIDMPLPIKVNDLVEEAKTQQALSSI